MLKIIKNVSLAILTTYSQFGSGVEGAGPEHNVFPAEYPVKFNGSFQGGPVATIEWSMSCSVDTFSDITGVATFERSFLSTESQVCNVVFSLEHTMTSTGNSL